MNNEDDAKEEKSKDDSSKKILDYSSQGEQSVFKVFGIELIAPSSLKNPGIVYLSFIVVNLIIFLVLKNLVSN